MGESIVVVDGDEAQCRELCELLERYDYCSTGFDTLVKLENEIQEGGYRVLIVNLDTIPVDNRFFKNFKRKNPTVHIVGLSTRTFHPELEEAMSQHIHSCLAKPLDEDELIFWLKSIFELNGNH